MAASVRHPPSLIVLETGGRQLGAELRNKRKKEETPTPGAKKIRLPYTGAPAPPGTTQAIVSTLMGGLTHPDWKTREDAIFSLRRFADDFDEARKALEALPLFGIVSQTIKDGDDIYSIVRFVEDHSFKEFLNALNTDGITFKFNRSIRGSGKITIQPVDGEPLGWNVEKSSHSITITPPEGKELVRGQNYTIQTQGC